MQLFKCINRAARGDVSVLFWLDWCSEEDGPVVATLVVNNLIISTLIVIAVFFFDFFVCMMMVGDPFSLTSDRLLSV